MGLSASKRVKRALHNSPEFDSACNSVYTQCLAHTQYAFPGVKPYQLFPAVKSLHHTLLSSSFPLVSKWVPRNPIREEVDRAFRAVISCRSDSQSEDDVVLDEPEFKEFCAEVIANAVVSSAGTEVLRKVPVGVVGIAGFGAVFKPGKGVVAAAIGAYALGVATSIYLRLDG